ncbi:MAG: MBL fold metallo-hydrolase [Deltaproteobacteria bacterium]|nr:MBL fold metallo-hydrolase [Deltaproteobacteria bacterium]
MRITVLGSGTGLPSLRRASPGLLVEAGGLRILMDTGPGTLRQVLKAGVELREIDFLCFTHHHPDHTLDLLAFLFASNNPLIPERKRPFVVVGAHGMRAWLKKAVALYGSSVVPPADSMELLELDPASGETALSSGLTLAAAPMEHRPGSLGFRLRDAEGRVMAYSGDTDVCDSLVDLGRNAHVLVLECSMPDDAKAPGHLTPSLAGAVAHRANARSLVLTHFYPPCDEIDVAAHCRRHFKGEIIVAEDLLKIDV